MGKKKFKLHLGWNHLTMNLMVTLSIGQTCSRKEKQKKKQKKQGLGHSET